MFSDWMVVMTVAKMHQNHCGEKACGFHLSLRSLSLGEAYLERGTAIANFNLATTERGYTMQNGTQVPDRTEWHPIVLWRNLAEWAEKYVRKGMKLYVEGKLQTRTWEKDGQVRRKTEIIAENIQVLYRPADYRSPNTDSNEEVVTQENITIPTLEVEDIF